MITTLKNKLLLSENAKLFDTKEYLFKTFIAVLIAAYIGSTNDYVSKDMISLLFGMMLTLEPVNMSGIRSGLSQIQATIIGAIVTGIVVGLIGYGVLATAVAITITLYVCMVIDWKNMMVVAVFTSIYMTQYVQTDALGNASEIETFKLRMAALGTGVLIAFLVNFIFSLIGYRRMANKRIFYISKELHEHMVIVEEALKGKNMEAVHAEMNKLPALFNMIDMVTGMLMDVKKDQNRFKIVYRHFEVGQFLQHATGLRGLTHQMYDLCMRIKRDESTYFGDDFVKQYSQRVQQLGQVKVALKEHKAIEPLELEVSDDSWIAQVDRIVQEIAK